MSRVDEHISAVRRRLWLIVFFDWLTICLSVLGALAVLLTLFQRLTHIGVPALLLWLGLLLACAQAVIMAIIRRPSASAAALAIDHKLCLKERLSTALAVRGSADPMACAAVLDAEHTAQNLSLRGQFPLRFPRTGYLALGVWLLSALVWWLMPQFDLLRREERQQARAREERRIAESRQLIQQTLARIDALPVALRENEQIRVGRFELQKMLDHPMPARDALARRQLELTATIEQALRQQAEQARIFAQAQKSASMLRGIQPPADAAGPVAQAHREIAKGNFQQAIEDLKKAVENFSNMSQEQKDQAASQMQQLAQQLAAISQKQQMQKNLAEQLQEAGISKDQIDKVLEALRRAAQGDRNAQQQIQQQLAEQMQGANQQQMQALRQAMQTALAQEQAAQLAQAAKSLAQAMQQQMAGGNATAGQQMAEAQQAMQDLLSQLEALQQDAQAVRAALEAMQDAMAQAGSQCGGPLEDIGQWDQGDPLRAGQGQGGPGIGMGGGLGKQASPFGVRQQLSRSQYNPQGEHLASVFVTDRSVRGESRAQLQKIAEAAQAEEGEDVDEGALDPRSRLIKRNYFRVIEEQAAKGP